MSILCRKNLEYLKYAVEICFTRSLKTILVSLFIVSLSRHNDINCSGNSSHALEFQKSEAKKYCREKILFIDPIGRRRL